MNNIALFLNLNSIRKPPIPKLKINNNQQITTIRKTKMENYFQVPQEQKQVLINSKNQEQNFSEQYHRISKLEFNREETKPRTPSQPSSDNKPSQEKKQ